MKISILLPYKENFSPEYPGAVSLFIKDTSSLSKYKKDLIIYGNTNYKNTFKLNYKNIELKKNLISSQTKQYVEKFVQLERKNKSTIIEIHNRPNYLNFIYKKLSFRNYTLFFHNDPLSMDGSKNIKDRIFLLNTCFKIIFNSNWSKKRFLEGLDNKFVNSSKLLVCFQSAKKGHIKYINKKKKWITFVGKLNRAKGYDIFTNTIKEILNKNKDWKAKIVGDEKREKIKLVHKNANLMGFQSHKNVLNLFKKSSIAVVCSRWEEPFGRTSLEAAANGCAVIISGRGGLPETVTNAIILKKLSVNELKKNILILIKDSRKRNLLQTLSIENFYLTHKYVSNLIDTYRDEKIENIHIFFTKKKKNHYVFFT